MQGNISPERAPVRPRVISANTGETILLEDLVLSHAERSRESLEIIGGPGYGKSTALAHIASLPEAQTFVFVDDAERDTIPSVPSDQLLIYTTRTGLNRTACRYHLASWSDDDLIEYLLRRFPESCASVISRYQGDPFGTILEGNPQLISLVADQMAECETLQVKAAFHQGLERSATDVSAQHHARMFSIAMLLQKTSVAAAKARDLQRLPTLRQLLSNRSVQVKFAADHLVSMLKEKSEIPDGRLPFDLVVATAELVCKDEEALEGVFKLLRKQRPTNPAMAASIVHFAHEGWRPNRKNQRNLADGYFRNAKWDKVDLRRVNLQRADLTGAFLRMANLERANLEDAQFQRSRLESTLFVLTASSKANFSEAWMAKANLQHGHFTACSFANANLSRVAAHSADFHDSDFTDANLSDGDFSGSDFRGASLAGADMSRAILRRAKLQGVDLRESLLDGADLSEAELMGCNLENVQVLGANLSHACLSGAVLSASVMLGADMQNAQLDGAGLADIDWWGANLRGADFRNCSFHLGSTRCGLVGSPYPSHGTRTGFYTDDFDDHTFKTPEEIRKANLCEADLRGANVFKADFYLVDLRGAQYDHDQYAHFRRCDAILDDGA